MPRRHKRRKIRPCPIDIICFTLSVLLAQMKDYVLNRGLSEPKFLLIVDEAHLFAKPPHLERETELTTMARMLRKFGLAIVLVAHNFKDIDDTFLTQAGWRIAMSHSDPRYVNDAEHYFSLRPEEVTWFSRGVRGRTILRRGFEPEEIAKTEQR